MKVRVLFSLRVARRQPTRLNFRPFCNVCNWQYLNLRKLTHSQTCQMPFCKCIQTGDDFVDLLRLVYSQSRCWKLVWFVSAQGTGNTSIQARGTTNGQWFTCQGLGSSYRWVSYIETHDYHKIVDLYRDRNFKQLDISLSITIAW